MSFNYGIATASIFAIAFLTTVLASTGILRVAAFALFWISILAMLICIMSKKRWTRSVWLGFGTFTACTITGVLISAGNLPDEMSLGVVVIGLLMVNAAVNAMGEPKKKKRRLALPVLGTKTGKKYHKPSCQLIKGKKNTVTYLSAEQAENDGKEPCGLCHF